MKLLFISSIVLFYIECVYSSGFDDDYVNHIIKNSWRKNEKIINITSNRIELKSRFECDSFDYRGPRPSSVHALRPNNIEIIGALGDSLTVGCGAKATTVLGLIEECRGVSWSIGGENPDIDQSVTLPNILRKFSPNIWGASTGTGTIDSFNSIFNLAERGKTAPSMLAQATDLVTKMKASYIDFTFGWKIVTLFVGGNDLCKSCKDEVKYSADKYIKSIKKTLDYLQLNLPRTLVNLVLTLDVTGIEELPGITCRTMQNMFCDCGLNQTYRGNLIELTKAIQKGTEDLVNDGSYDTSDNFTVVVQPFMKKMRPPKKADGSPDYSYFSPDCFHFSVKGHEAAAIELWNNMLTPVGQKSDKWSNTNELLCPSMNAPYIYTNKNSQQN